MRRARGTAAGLLGLLLAAVGTTAAGEPPLAPAEPEEPPFEFKREGYRDPFTYWLEVPHDEGTGLAVEPPEILNRKRREAAESFCARAEEAMKNSYHERAVQLCGQGLDELGKLNISEKPELEELHERLYRLQRAADRLHKRGEAETAFKNLNLKVTGIVARENRPLAIVNGRTLGKGSLIETMESTEGAIYVDDIQPNRVIVRFRGFRIELPVQ